MKKFIYNHAAGLSLIWTVVIFLLCATPGQYIPSANWLELLSLDKFVHAAVFFVLTALLLLVSVKYNQRKVFVIVYCVFAIGYGLLLEFMQARYFSNRSADWFDVIANSAGCIIALVLYGKIRKTFTEDKL